MKERSIVYILDEFPSASEYFILNEIIHLRKRGLSIEVLALKKGRYPADIHPSDIVRPQYVSPVFFSLRANLYCLLKYTGNYLSCPWKTKKMSFFRKLLRFLAAVDLLYKTRHLSVKHIHAHFMTTPAELAVYMSEIAGIPFSISAHARDIYTSSRDSIGRLTRSAAFIITCTKFNRSFLTGMVPKDLHHKIVHIYHGLDLRLWSPKLTRHTRSNKTIRIISVGRLVEKKGMIWLLKAVRYLKMLDYKAHCAIVGDGPLKNEIKTYISKEDLTGMTTLYGQLDQSSIKALYNDSDIFVLPCIVAADGDMDGLPNVLLEALGMGLPVVTTALSAIPELIEHEKTGLIVPGCDAKAIAASIIRLASDNHLYNALVANGREMVSREFNISSATEELHRAFTAHMDKNEKEI